MGWGDNILAVHLYEGCHVIKCHACINFEWKNSVRVRSNCAIVCVLGKTWARGRVHIFPYMEQNPTGPTRTDEHTRLNAKNALSADSPVRMYSVLVVVCFITLFQAYGVKSPSWLGTIPNFDLVRGMSYDYMHSVLLGMCCILLRLWHDSKHHQEIWYLGPN